MKVGAEPKKLAILGVLGAAAAVLFYQNVLSGPDTPDYAPPPKQNPPATTTAGPPASAAKGAAAPQAANVRRPGRVRSTDEFRPKLPVKPEEKPDPSKVDPMLRLDLLAKVQSVELEGGRRSLFQFGLAPPPEAPKIKDAPKIKPGEGKPGETAAGKPPATDPAKPVEPPPPPITLKFYGYSSARRDGVKRAFFLDGDDILIGAEGELVKKRYKVVRIGVNSVVVQDTQYKNNEQTLILQQEQTS